MAFETGTASNHLDLINKLKDFLTTNADLVAAGQAWEVVGGPTGAVGLEQYVTFRGPGLAGADNIYCSVKCIQDLDNDKYALQFHGHAAYNDGDTQDNQPIQSAFQYILAWGNAMQYWFIANGRRWIVITKVSGIYGSAYCGLFLPYSPPSEYTYPFYNAGSTSSSFLRYSTTDEGSRFLASPGYESAQVFRPDNQWSYVANFTSSGGGGAPDDAWMHPTRFKLTGITHDGRSSFEGDDIMYYTQNCFDDSFFMRQLQIQISTPFKGILGVLDGVFSVTGRSNASENIIDKDGVNYLVVQNIFRTDFQDYMAVRLD